MRFVPNGEFVVLSFQISNEIGSPWFYLAGLTQSKLPDWIWIVKRRRDNNKIFIQRDFI